MKRAFVFASALVLLAPRARAATEQVEISGPILPSTMVLYAAEGAYPDTADGETALATAAALPFPRLLEECAPLYPEITLSSPGDAPLSQAELRINYAEVATCSYEQYTAKPYWIPKLVDDVDICSIGLGSDFRLITEADVASLGEPDFQLLADTLSLTESAMSSLGQMYFSLHVYVRGDDGTLKIADLRPGVSPRVMNLPVSEDAMKKHYESDVSLRCIRRTTLDD